MKRILLILISIFCVNNFIYSYSISDNGKRLIQKYEKLVLLAYKDGNGYSIGWGHHMPSGPILTKISKEKANQLFKQDIDKTNKTINRLLKPFNGRYKFSQSFIDGLGDLIYNCGEGGVRNSEFYRRLLNCRIKNRVINQNDLNFTIAAIKNMKITCKAHVNRRYETHKRMLN